MDTLTKEPNEELVMEISKLLLKNGMKATTMDSVASALTMSKRTLYEIFDSKKDMILRAVKYWQQQRFKKVEEIFKSSKTVMEALARTFAYHKSMMNNINVEFLFDMDDYAPEVRTLFTRHSHQWVDKMMYAINLGIEQGVFRTDVNYPIVLRLMRIQMESLKKMEDSFPKDITIMDAFDSIVISFLRSIGTQEGMDIIDNFYLNNQEYSNSFITETNS
ncbi:MAG: TetR/AcrR family transcriptional regulator [Muribaculaceae bacterium]|nr:TetR/AcrR family transcriptional regulator [Muribaculaceae bacterium]